MASVIVDVTGRIARLFQDDPREFVAHRNALARDLAKTGQKDLSARIRTLTRPSTSAWLVNQLYWHERAEYDALLAAGAAAREAQQSRLSGRGGDLVRALAERDVIIGRLVGQAERIAAAGGVTLSADVRTRARTTLEAIALRAGDASVMHGQLSEDVALPGLQALAGLVLRTDTADAAPTPRRVLALVEEPTARRDAREEREALEREHAAIASERERAEADLLTARDAAEVADGAVMAARQQLQAAQRALEVAQQRLQQAETFQASAVARAATTTEAAAEADRRLRDLQAREEEVSARLQRATAPRRHVRPSKPR